MPLDPVLEPQEVKFAAALKNGECCIFTGAGVSAAIVDIDPTVSQANSKIIISTVGSWAGFLRAAATEFFKSNASSHLPLEDVKSLLEFGSYVNGKLTVFGGDSEVVNSVKEAVREAIFGRKGFLQNESIPQDSNDKKKFALEVDVEIQRIKLVIDRVYDALPKTSSFSFEKDLLKEVALIPWGNWTAIDDSTKILTELINKMNEGLGYITPGNLWERSSKTIKQRIDELEQEIIDNKNNQDEKKKRRLEYIKSRYTELRELYDKFSDDFEEGEYVEEFITDFQTTLAGVFSINGDNLNKTFRHLAELVLSPLRANPYSPLAKALDTICENNVLLTSNYDTFLGSALSRNILDYTTDLAESNQLDLLIPDDIKNDIKIHNRYVIHVHGLYYDKGTFVISEEEYKNTTSSFVKFMKILILEKKRSLVFIGVSADGWTDWHMSHLFRDLATMDNTNDHPHHYWLVIRGTNFPNEDDFSELSSREDRKITLDYVCTKVKTVTYGDSYDDLAPYLVYISKYTPPSKAKVV